MVSGSGAHEAGAVVHVGRAGLGVRETRQNQGRFREQGDLEALPPERGDHSIDLFWPHPSWVDGGIRIYGSGFQLAGSWAAGDRGGQSQGFPGAPSGGDYVLRDLYRGQPRRGHRLCLSRPPYQVYLTPR